jgi:hypothetical protein
MPRPYKLTRLPSGNILLTNPCGRYVQTFYVYNGPSRSGKNVWRAYEIFEAHYLNDGKPEIRYANTGRTLGRLLSLMNGAGGNIHRNRG